VQEVIFSIAYAARYHPTDRRLSFAENGNKVRIMRINIQKN
jgi:hypothetical protein